jgi:hypothetical protein
MPTNVTLLLRGLLVLAAREGQTTGKVGILKAPPQGHELTIAISEHPPTGPDPDPITLTRRQIMDTLLLSIENDAQPTITIPNKKPVNRLAHPTEEDSFRWVVDLERAGELYDFSIGANRSELMPILTFNSGQLFAADLSESFLLVQEGIFSPYRDFGRVALAIGIRFPSATRAVFKNGDVPLFDSETSPGTDYVIEITHDAPEHPSVVTDANNYYKALGAGIPVEQKILFMSLAYPRILRERFEKAQRDNNKELADTINSLIEKLGHPAGPEAACFAAYLGRTEL